MRKEKMWNYYVYKYAINYSLRIIHVEKWLFRHTSHSARVADCSTSVLTDLHSLICCVMKQQQRKGQTGSDRGGLMWRSMSGLSIVLQPWRTDTAKPRSLRCTKVKLLRAVSHCSSRTTITAHVPRGMYEICLFSLSLTVIWEDWSHSDVWSLVIVTVNQNLLKYAAFGDTSK